MTTDLPFLPSPRSLIGRTVHYKAGWATKGWQFIGAKTLPSIEVAIPTEQAWCGSFNCKVRVHFRTSDGREIDPQ